MESFIPLSRYWEMISNGFNWKKNFWHDWCFLGATERRREAGGRADSNEVDHESTFGIGG
jgi:hypothetical protein